MSITSVFQIIQLVIPAIQTAEEFIRGAGRGEEKKQAVLGKFIQQINQLKKETGELTQIDLKSFNWVKFGLSSPVFLTKVGTLIDAVVDLANFVESFDDKPEEKTEVVN